MLFVAFRDTRAPTAATGAKRKQHLNGKKGEISSRKRSRPGISSARQKARASERALRVRFISVSKNRSPPVNPSSITENIKNSTLPRDLAPLSSSLFKLCIAFFSVRQHTRLPWRKNLSSRAPFYVYQWWRLVLPVVFLMTSLLTVADSVWQRYQKNSRTGNRGVCNGMRFYPPSNAGWTVD